MPKKNRNMVFFKIHTDYGSFHSEHLGCFELWNWRIS